MIIDFHTHIFPDSIAERATEALKKNAHGEYAPVHDLTEKGLLKAMDEAGIDVSVVVPVATKPAHSLKNIEWGARFRSDRLIPFAGLFPDAESWKKNVDLAVANGYKGIKSNPAMFRKVVRAMRGGTIVAAHLGGQQQWEEVEDKLVGENIYLDTSMGTEYYGKERFKSILAGHGADKILFATDSPWSDASVEIKNLKSWDIPSGDLEKIFYRNAARLLELN